jgi:hypothetical protein
MQIGFFNLARFVLVWFLGQKLVLGHKLFFQFGSVFSSLARFWIGFFGSVRFFLVFFGLGSVWFFLFQAYKIGTKPNRFVFKKF